MAGTAWPTLTDGQKFKASSVERKFDWLEGSLVPHSGVTLQDAAWDLGTSTARWNILYAKNLRASDILIAPSGGTVLLQPGTGTTSLAIKRSDDDVFGVLSIYAGEFSLYGSSSVLAMRVGTDGTLILRNGVAVNEFSSDNTLAGNSDLAVPTEKAVIEYALSKVNQRYNFSSSNGGLFNTVTSILVASESFDPDTTLSIFDIDVMGHVNFLLSTGAGTPGRTSLIFDLGTPAKRLMAQHHANISNYQHYHSLKAHARFTNVSHVGTFTVNMYVDKGLAGSTITVEAYSLLISPEIAT